MNTKDNKRDQETIQRVYATFAELLREQELNEISVTELCESANIPMWYPCFSVKIAGNIRRILLFNVIIDIILFA